MEESIMKPQGGAINVKTTILGLAVATAFAADPVQAAFLAPGSSGSIAVTGGCFAWGVCAVGGFGNITDVYNDTTLGIGSGVTGNGRIGQMNFTVDADGNTIHLTSFEMDTYQGSASGDTNTRMVNPSAASGFISDSGDMTLDLTGRTAAMQFFSFLGEQAWNLDTHSYGLCIPGSGTYTLFTTGTSSNMDCNIGATNTTLTGSALVGGGGTWTGTDRVCRQRGQRLGPVRRHPVHGNLQHHRHRHHRGCSGSGHGLAVRVGAVGSDGCDET
jgi:hypothetical protein